MLTLSTIGAIFKLLIYSTERRVKKEPTRRVRNNHKNFKKIYKDVENDYKKNYN